MTDIAAVSLTRTPDLPAALGASFRRFGFAVVADHGIPAELIAGAEAASRALFALPVAAKARFHVPGSGGARGYTPFGVEAAKGAAAHDLKEFWHIGRALPAGHPFEAVMPANLWPDVEVPAFRATMLELFAAFDRVGAKLLDAISTHLRIEPALLRDSVRDGNSILRLLHYPPVAADAAGVRAGAHEDINVITLLLGAEEAGLELLDRDGRWLPVRPGPGELVVNIGDMLQRLTNGVLRSTSHRVVNPAPERASVSRYSMPFFLHFRPDFLIETLPGTVTPDNPQRWAEPITANDFLQQRLREIRLV